MNDSRNNNTETKISNLVPFVFFSSGIGAVLGLVAYVKDWI